MKERIWVILAGVVVGVLAVLLVVFGNPANMGFCIACFLRDTAGALGLHKAEVVQYIRPEILGLVLGAFIMALARKEFAPRGGASPATRFVLGFCVMVGALMFLGCPLRMLLRIGGGDLNALVGLVGFIAGIGVGVFCLNKGFSLGRAYSLGKGEGLVAPAVNVGLLVLLCALPGLLIFSQSGPGSMRAPILMALAAGLIVGILAQRSRLCTVGGIRDVILFRDPHLLWGAVAIVVVAVIANLIAGFFNLGFEGQPVAHSDGLWNFLGMLLTGFGSVLLGGCPLRQLILSGEGNTDSFMAVCGLVIGAAFCHNFGLASSAEGPSANGPWAVIICLVVVAVIAAVNIRRGKAAA
ncbi:MAG: YedE family putative selenium transporter [Bacillota bacterium]|nr:YedE family putative selenium transporter [Bacillota bacterium]